MKAKELVNRLSCANPEATIQFSTPDARDWDIQDIYGFDTDDHLMGHTDVIYIELQEAIES